MGNRCDISQCCETMIILISFAIWGDIDKFYVHGDIGLCYYRDQASVSINEDIGKFYDQGLYGQW